MPTVPPGEFILKITPFTFLSSSAEFKALNAANEEFSSSPKTVFADSDEMTPSNLITAILLFCATISFIETEFFLDCIFLFTGDKIPSNNDITQSISTTVNNLFLLFILAFH